MKNGRTLEACGDEPSGWFEAECPCRHGESFWLCLRHGQNALAGSPAALCERCFGQKGHPDHGRCQMKVRMLAAA